MLTPLAAISVSAGQADYWRGTGDFNLPLSATAAARVTLMDQRNGVVDRDQVLYRRYGVAPTLSFGIDTPTRLTLSYFKEEENNLPDYGIPFIDGAPAHVERSNYYSLVNYDRTRTNTNIGTIRFEHDFSDDVTLSDSLRYANYGFEYLVTGPFSATISCDRRRRARRMPTSRSRAISRAAPAPRVLLINRTDVTAKFDVARLQEHAHRRLELSKEQSNVNRFQNGLDDIPPTPLLNPVAFLHAADAARRLFQSEGPRQRCERVCAGQHRLGAALGRGCGIALGSLQVELQRSVLGHRHLSAPTPS